MINSIKINLIKNFIKSIEIIQALTNTDIYSIVRIKKYNNLKLFLDNNFSNSYIRWKENNKSLEKDLLLLHNISYNHWIRSYLATKITRKNIILNFSCYLGIIKNLILLILFYIKVKISQIRFDNKIININNKNGIDDIKYKFLSSQKGSRFEEIANYLENNFNESIKYENVNFIYKFEISNFKEKDLSKINILNSVIKYCLRFPFMAKHHKQLFQGLYIYNYFKKNSLKKTHFSLAKEIYSMETRSLAIASTKYKNATYIIKHNKFEALPYDMYSLNMSNKPIYLDDLLTAKEEKIFKTKDKSLGKTIVIQASDSCGSSISTYEFDSYVDIINVLEKLNYKGEIIFKFHPANIKFFVNLKKDICSYYLRSKKIKLKFAHKNKDIETYASTCNFMISIDYSTSFLDILRMNIPIVYFNRNFDRHIINKSSQINNFSIYEMVSSKQELEKKLINLL